MDFSFQFFPFFNGKHVCQVQYCFMHRLRCLNSFLTCSIVYSESRQDWKCLPRRFPLIRNAESGGLEGGIPAKPGSERFSSVWPLWTAERQEVLIGLIVKGNLPSLGWAGHDHLQPTGTDRIHCYVVSPTSCSHSEYHLSASPHMQRLIPLHLGLSFRYHP